MQTEPQSSISKTYAPLAGELSDPIKSYNRALPWLATAGTLSEDGIGTVLKAGFRTIIDLRIAEEGTAEEKSQAEAAGITYINIQVEKTGILASQFQCFTNVLKNIEKPVLLHCASAGRAGAMITLYHIQNGMDKETAFELGRAANMPEGFEKTVRDNLDEILSI